MYAIQTNGAQVSRHFFLDWAGQQVRYRTRATRVNEQGAEPGEWITCDIDPHECDEWTPMGRGHTTTEAVTRAIDNWNEESRQST